MSGDKSQALGEEALKARTAEFREEVQKVADGVYFALGFGGGNVTLIEGDKGAIMVDTLSSVADAEAAKTELDKLTTRPVHTIIYTHSHPDHTGGAAVFAPRESQPQVISREPFGDAGAPRALQPIGARRGARQFGIGLSPEELLSMGITAAGTRPPSGAAAYLPPTRQFAEQTLRLTVDGVELELVAAPGESDDHLFVWLPQRKVLMCGDNYYKSFPNMSPVRGGPYRDVAKWVASLDKIIALEPEVLLPGHSDAVIGKANVKDVLTSYRNGIDFVLQETLKYMGQGLTPDELVQVVKLPPELADKPYLQGLYGFVDWSVRAIYAGHLGWFDGNPTHLNPLAPKDKAARVAAAVGGAPNLLSQATAARDAGDAQWAAELADYLLELGEYIPEAKRIKIDACRVLARQQTSAGGRHYYFVYANELEQSLQ